MPTQQTPPAPRVNHCVRDRWFAGSTLLLIAPLTLAQSLGDFAQCAELDDDVQRLACYDRLLPPALKAQEQSPSITAKRRSSPDATASPEPTTPAEPTAPAEPKAPPEAAASREANPPPSSDDRVARERSQDATDSASASDSVLIVEIRESPARKLVFLTEDGQIWEQIDSHSPVFHDIPFPANIRRGSFGSHFLRSEQHGAAVRVRRRR
ncbi:hypothetical protein BH24PSE2_BH24PSE2_20450 [soil metagenome]